jgi:hypothetical protein
MTEIKVHINYPSHQPNACNDGFEIKLHFQKYKKLQTLVEVMN